MKQQIRIGNAGGYWGDDLSALRRQLEGGTLDYVTMDFLAEITMSILQKQRLKNPEFGYAGDFVQQIRDTLPLIVEKNVTVITNAGGINPIGLGRKLRAIATELELPVTIGVVQGDDIMPELERLSSLGETFENMETGESFGPIRSRLTSANVYFGAEPVVKALQAGCKIIVTGRVTDTGITLAPMLHEFGWANDDWDKIAAGIVAGHIIECGTQTSGGNLTDWHRVKTFKNIGYPIIEMSASGDFVVTKHPGTGGMVSEQSVKEQLVYEMGDPANYIAPDGVARFDSIRLKTDGKDRVRVFGITGKPAPPMLKVSMSFDDGYKASGELLMSGPNTLKKAQVMADVFWSRLGQSYEATRTEFLGTGSIWPKTLSKTEPNEILLRLSVRDDDSAKVEEFGKLLPSLILSGPSGVAVTGGRPKPTPVVAYWPALMKRDHARAEIVILKPDGNEVRTTLQLHRNGTAQPVDSPSTAYRKRKEKTSGGRLKRVKLLELAYARSGDKGDTCNIGVLARSQDMYAWLRDHLTADVVKKFFKGIVHGRVIRYELDNLLGLNFLLEQTLGGGGTRSLMIDPQGKTLSQALLQMELMAPAGILRRKARNV